MLWRVPEGAPAPRPGFSPADSDLGRWLTIMIWIWVPCGPGRDVGAVAFQR